MNNKKKLLAVEILSFANKTHRGYINLVKILLLLNVISFN